MDFVRSTSVVSLIFKSELSESYISLLSAISSSSSSYGTGSKSSINLISLSVKSAGLMTDIYLT